jgi:hypothetical protein
MFKRDRTRPLLCCGFARAYISSHDRDSTWTTTTTKPTLPFFLPQWGSQLFFVLSPLFRRRPLYPNYQLISLVSSFLEPELEPSRHLWRGRGGSNQKEKREERERERKMMLD